MVRGKTLSLEPEARRNNQEIQRRLVNQRDVFVLYPESNGKLLRGFIGRGEECGHMFRLIFEHGDFVCGESIVGYRIEIRLNKLLYRLIRLVVLGRDDGDLDQAIRIKHGEN